MRRLDVWAVALAATMLAAVSALVAFPARTAAATARPTIVAVGPKAGPVAGGVRVTVFGRHFARVRSVRFGRVDATGVRVLSSTELRAVAPQHAAGDVDVRVRTSAGLSPTAAADRFEYEPRPTVTAVSPSSGRQGGGETITVSGTGFAHVRAVRFGSRPAGSWQVRSKTRLRVLVPGQDPGTVHVRVTTAGGESARSANDRFSYVLPPAVTGVTPSAGALAGGARVTVVGHRFLGVAAVRFGAVVGTDVTVLSPSELQVTAPPGSAGEVDVTVEGSYGTSAASSVDSYAYVPPPAAPTVTSVAAPGPFAADSAAGARIRDTACTATTCFAVGYYETDSAEVPIVETLTDDGWSWAGASRPADAFAPSIAQLVSISCTQDRCVAFGSYVTKAGRIYPLVQTYDGNTWAASAGATPVGEFNAEYNDVACASATACIASGDSPSGSFLAHWNGSNWSLQAIPTPTGVTVTGISQVAVACGSSSYCVFAGIYSANDGYQHAFGVTWRSGTWTAAALPAPADGVTSSLMYDVACPSANQCVAVGDYKNADATAFRGLIASDTDGTWSAIPAPLPSDAVADTDVITALTSIACGSGRCTASGVYDTEQGMDGFVDTLGNGDWSTERIGKADDEPGTQRRLNGTACVADTQCVFVGEDDPTTGSTAGVAAVRDPGGSAQAAVPLPDGVTDADLSLDDVACNGDGVCSAIAIARPTGQAAPSQFVLVTIKT